MSIMAQIQYPYMKELSKVQRDWFDWMCFHKDGRRFVEWTGVGIDTRNELHSIYHSGEYDAANDGGILNDFIGLYREWSHDTGIKWKSK